MEANELLQQLESRLASRPNSPLFARLAELLLEQGETTRAIELCEKGMETYPEYTTGFLVAAMCYHAAGRSSDAERVLRYILKHHTRHSTALNFLEEIKNAKNGGAQFQAGHAAAFEAFSKRLREELSGTENTLGIEEFLAPQPEELGSIEEIAESLKGAKIRPTPEPAPPQPAATKPSNTADPAIASATLADIFEKQGQYAEAIATYKKMIENNPNERRHYEQRIEALQQLLESRAFGL